MIEWRGMEEAMVDLPEIEYLDGVAYPKVSPKRTHALVQAAAIRVLSRCVGTRGFVGSEWDFCLGASDWTDTKFVPDVAYVSLARLRALPKEKREEPPFAPDVAVEIRSPSYRSEFAVQKVARYLSTGAVLVLDVDPAQRMVIAHSTFGVRPYAQGKGFSHDAVPWLCFRIRELFAELDLLD